MIKQLEHVFALNSQIMTADRRPTENNAACQHTDCQKRLVEILEWNMSQIFYLIWTQKVSTTAATISNVWSKIFGEGC